MFELTYWPVRISAFLVMALYKLASYSFMRFWSSCFTGWYIKARNILIFTLPLLWYLYDDLFDWLGNQRVTSIIWPGNLKLIAEVMGGDLPAMFQDLSRSGPRMMEISLLVWPLWHGFVVMPWWSSRCPWIALENNVRSHVSIGGCFYGTFLDSFLHISTQILFGANIKNLTGQKIIFIGILVGAFWGPSPMEMNFWWLV